MSDLKEIKVRIYNERRIEDVLSAMGCEYITYSGGRVEAQLPDRYNSNNRRSVQVKENDSLSSNIRNRADFERGDIYSLVSYIHHDKRSEEDIKKDLHNAKVFICETLGWGEYLDGKYEVKKDYLAPLRAITNLRKRKREIVPNPPIPESTLDEYLPFPYAKWIEEGISFKTQKMYDIRFDLESKRVIIPMRNRFGDLVGVKGRIMNDEDDDRKYLYLHKFNNSQEVFNFNYAHHYILMEKRVYIFEGEKSCMKMFDNKVFNTVCIGSSDISDVQASIIKQLGIDIEVVICYDKDKNVDEIKRVAEFFKGRKIFGMIDTKGLLEEKDSPIDKGIDVFNELVRDCIYPI